ncbi:MAG: ATP-binding cassette domain-containing protein, partial [Spirochaetales bacterium]|nr:ATP-binding cassette domain-containing protein [Spirochaetales bacterium]
MTRTPAVEFVHLSMKFGSFLALEDVNLVWEPHKFHVLLGENGAGKSTLVKCLIGYQKPTSGQLIVDGKEVAFNSTREAHQVGLGMVYQHFTLADNLTVLENFLLSREDLPLAFSLEQEGKALALWMRSMPFQLPVQVPVGALSAGEKQKLEILIQLFHKRSILILDEPTSVLTPDEADEVLGLLKEKVQAKELTVLLITHKFREFERYGDTAAVLRKGRLVGA